MRWIIQRFSLTRPHWADSVLELAIPNTIFFRCLNGTYAPTVLWSFISAWKKLAQVAIYSINVQLNTWQFCFVKLNFHWGDVAVVVPIRVYCGYGRIHHTAPWRGTPYLLLHLKHSRNNAVILMIHLHSSIVFQNTRIFNLKGLKGCYSKYTSCASPERRITLFTTFQKLWMLLHWTVHTVGWPFSIVKKLKKLHFFYLKSLFPEKHTTYSNPFFFYQCSLLIHR